MPISLRAPTVELRDAWLQAHAEWGLGLHEDGFGITVQDDLTSPTGFATWLDRLEKDAGRCTYRWIVDDGQVLGGIALRHYLDGVHGHIGYGIRPSARGRGVATWALAAILTDARSAGLEQVLLVCEADNLPSARTIERNGGRLQTRSGTAQDGARRYWIDLHVAPGAG